MVLYDIDDYMRYVEDWFVVQENKHSWLHGKEANIARRIYLATDDASVVTELREKLVVFALSLFGCSDNAAKR